MTAEIISFAAPSRQQRAESVRHHPYDFWVEILDGLCPTERRRTVRRALQCCVIDGEDAKIFLEMWPDRKDV